MFDNLIESKQKRQRRFGQTLFSLAVHAVLIFLAVKATQVVATADAKPEVDTTMSFLKPPEPPPEPPPPPPEEVIVSANPPPKGFQTVVAVADIPKDIPPVNLNEKAFNPSDFTGKGVEGGIATGVVGGTGPVDLNSVVTSAEADEPPSLLSAGPKITPPGMGGVPGRVKFEFIVDTTGHVEANSVRLLESTNQIFVESAKAMLLKSVYKPGRLAGHPIRVKVSQNISFTAGG
ncbi:MAG TPA: energy transducer TonB [Gemmatimonadales bacterium]|nr:energy transducer TonB [Gemmatimonadales bacterium]